MIQFDSFIMYNVDKTDRELLLNYSCHILNKAAKPTLEYTSLCSFVTDLS